MILDLFIIIALVAFAIFLLILEIFFLPGLSVAGIFSFIFYGVALYYAFAEVSTAIGFITLALAIILSVFIVWYFMRSRTLDKMSLHTAIDTTAPTEVSNNLKVGDQGTALSRLNPMGRVLIGNTTAEARALDFIDEGTPVVITHIERTTILVEPIDKA